MGALEGKVAIITGATSGIGARTAELFVAEGAKVVVAGRRQAEGDALAKQLGAAAIFARTDVTKEADVKALIEQALAKFGRLDCLFNNAGNPGKLAPIADIDMAHFDTVMATHVRGVVLGMKHAAPAMIRQGSGSIINTGSIAGLRAGYSAHSYSAAKAAVIHVTRCVAAELGEKGIRVNSISPGAIVTGIFAKGAGLPDAVADRTAAGLKERFAAFQPIPRAGLPEDIAQAALFLASDAGSFVNGHDIVVDGGVVIGSRWSQLVKTRTGLAEELKSRAG
ncbi:MAG TPA: SDR family oxidoreductase [Candidatus Acidoferrum sp.]|nr:SDR family oxidoreductase [Candidatus Acidoferrum sp.]